MAFNGNPDAKNLAPQPRFGDAVCREQAYASRDGAADLSRLGVTRICCRRCVAFDSGCSHYSSPRAKGFCFRLDRLPLPRVPLPVAGRFFMGQSHLSQRMPDTMTGNAKLPRTLFLRAIRALFDIEAQRLPVKPPRPPRTGTSEAEPIRCTHPAIDAGPAHLKPTGRFHLASAALHKFYDPFA